MLRYLVLIPFTELWGFSLLHSYYVFHRLVTPLPCRGGNKCRWSTDLPSQLNSWCRKMGWLVGGWALPLWKIMEFVSWEDDIIPITEWKSKIQCLKPPTRWKWLRWRFTVYRFERSWVLGLSILGYVFFHAFANGVKKMPIPQAPTHHGWQGDIPVAWIEVWNTSYKRMSKNMVYQPKLTSYRPYREHDDKR